VGVEETAAEMICFISLWGIDKSGLSLVRDCDLPAITCLYIGHANDDTCCSKCSSLVLTRDGFAMGSSLITF